MDPIFDRGNYQLFLSIAPKGLLDQPKFAFPVFEGELVSDVITRYMDLYVPKNAKVRKRENDPDNAYFWGCVHYDVRVDGVDYVLSTVTTGYMLWPQLVLQWEDQWVFDHLTHIGETIPPATTRKLVGSRLTQQQVADSAYSTFSRYMAMTLTLYTAFIFTRN